VEKSIHKPRVVIIGAGFGGIFCAKGLVGSNSHITIIDKQNHHLFQPLIYQVATGFLGINDVALPIRSLFRGKENIDIVMSEVTGIDTKNQLVLTNNHSYEYDYLVIGTGAHYHFFGNDNWQPNVKVLKTLADAISLRQQILMAFEKAEIETDVTIRRTLLTFVVIGGGPTGVEMAGAIADVINYALKYEFRNIRRHDARIVLLEAADRVLGGMRKSLSQYTKKILEKKGVEVHCNKTVQDILPNKIITKDETIEAETILWAAGVRANNAASWLGLPAAKNGGVLVKDDLSVEGFTNIFVIGDNSCLMKKDRPLPALASVAKQQGKYMAKVLNEKLDGREYKKPFRYLDMGTMSTIGRNSAVAQFKIFIIKGWLAWMMWGVVHIFFLTGFRNRITVFLTWSWTYLTYGIGSRIILKNPKK